MKRTHPDLNCPYAVYFEDLARFESFEVSGVVNDLHDNPDEGTMCEPTDDDSEAEFWSVYGRDDETGEAECLGDFGTRALAERFRDSLIARDLGFAPYFKWDCARCKARDLPCRHDDDYTTDAGGPLCESCWIDAVNED